MYFEMYRCRTRRHSWPTQDEARRCCNGWTCVYEPMVPDPTGSGSLWTWLVPDTDVATIERLRRHRPLEERSSTPRNPWLRRRM